MSFKSIFKKSFLQGFTRFDFTPQNIIAAFVIATFFAVFIFFAYRILTKKTFYSKTFNIALPVLTIITTGIVLALQSNAVIALGMVGALSIVRFRTAVKDAMDLVFLFWAIGTGIICGAGIAEIACALSFIIVLMLFVLDRIPVARAPKILMVSAGGYESEAEILSVVKEHCRYFTVKSRSLADGRLDMVVEVRTDRDQSLAKGVASVSAVSACTLLAHDGEVTY